jgi:predicted nucleic acid-binding protein
MDRVYLDYNCFQRPFDDPSNTRIQIEALACIEIIRLADEREVELVWSFMHDDEARRCPFPDRRLATFRLAKVCAKRQEPTDKIRRQALSFVAEHRLSPKDALHLAAGLAAKAAYLLTCDDAFMQRASSARPGLEVMNPVDYIRMQKR